MRRILTAAAFAVVSVAASVALLSPADVSAQLEAVFDERIEESKAVLLPDGGKGYVWPATLSDGGDTMVVSDSAPCVRRPLGVSADSCGRLFVDAGIIVDPGALNRFPATQAAGWTCQPVACSVVSGENPDNPEGWP